MSTTDEPEIDDLQRLLDEGTQREIEDFLALLHPADVADLLEALGDHHRARVIRILPTAAAAPAIIELEEGHRARLLTQLSDHEVIEVAQTVETDDAADLLSLLPQDRRHRVLRDLGDHAAEIRSLLSYPPDTAGGLMQTELVTVSSDTSVARAFETLRTHPDKPDEIHRLFVVDSLGRLEGMVSLSDLVLADPDEGIENLMEPQVIAVRAGVDQEEVARTVEKYDYVSLPVVDERRVLLGRIAVDDVLDVVTEEANEDILLMGGLSDTEPLETERLLPMARARLSWLLVTFFGGLINVFVISKQLPTENTVALMAFLPLLVALGGGVGNQTATLTTRGIALGNTSLSSMRGALMREAGIGLMLGLSLGLLLALVAYSLFDDPWLAIVLAVSMSLSLTTAATMGVVTPLSFDRFGIDPALAAGPIVSISNDIVGVLIYLSTATVLLR